MSHHSTLPASCVSITFTSALWAILIYEIFNRVQTCKVQIIWNQQSRTKLTIALTREANWKLTRRHAEAAKPAARASWLPNDLHQQENAFGQKGQKGHKRQKRSETIWNDLKRSETIWNDLKRSETVWKDLKRSETIWNDLKRSETIWNDLKRSETTWNDLKRSETIWNGLKRSETIWNDLKQSETIWNDLKRSETIWNDLKRSETIWNDLKRSETVWNGLKRSEKIWNDLKRAETIWNDLKRSETIWNDLKRSETIWNGWTPFWLPWGGLQVNDSSMSMLQTNRPGWRICWRTLKNPMNYQKRSDQGQLRDKPLNKRQCWRQHQEKTSAGDFDHAKKRSKDRMHTYAATHACASFPLFRTCCTGMTENTMAKVSKLQSTGSARLSQVQWSRSKVIRNIGICLWTLDAAMTFWMQLSKSIYTNITNQYNEHIPVQSHSFMCHSHPQPTNCGVFFAPLGELQWWHGGPPWDGKMKSWVSQRLQVSPT